MMKTKKLTFALVGVGVCLAGCSGAAPTQSDSESQSEPVTPGCVQGLNSHEVCSYNVAPRVNCGGFNGHVEIINDFSGTSSLNVYGEAWDTCGGETYVYLEWSQNCLLNLGCARGGNNDAGHSGPHQTTGINYWNYSPGFSPGGVSRVGVTVCNTSGGWHCGSKWAV